MGSKKKNPSDDTRLSRGRVQKEGTAFPVPPSHVGIPTDYFDTLNEIIVQRTVAQFPWRCNLALLEKHSGHSEHLWTEVPPEDTVREPAARYGSPPYTLTHRALTLVEAIGEALGRAGLSAPVQPRLRRANHIRSVQGSVAIEGNTLNEEQISAILEGKRVFAPPQEILEVQNAWRAYEMLSDWDPGREADLLAAHGVLMQGLLEDAGRYRRKQAGIMGRVEIIHIAPPADRVPFLIQDLLRWLSATEMPPLISAAIFHYEFEFIHPFADGNGRLGRLWQTLILRRWNPLFADLPVESLIHQHQQDYYEAINQANRQNDSAPFVEFMLARILETLRTDQVTDQVNDQVKRLLAIMGPEPLSAAELMQKLQLSHRPSFRNNYLRPALDTGLIEMTRPDSPTAPDQKYRLSTPIQGKEVGYGG